MCLTNVARIAHISDMHFGRADPRAVERLAERLNALNPQLVVGTGDFTQSGRRREFEEAAAFFERVAPPFLVVPGNHDVPVYDLAARFGSPWARFERHLGPAEVRSAEAGEFVIIGVNSARRASPRLNWAYGRLSNRAIDAVCDLARAAIRSGRYAIAACHHPFVESANRAGAEIVGNGRRALERFAAAGVVAVMTGHAHVAHATPVALTGNRILSIQAGTATSTRQRGEKPGFAALDLGADTVRILQYVFGYGEYHAGEEAVFVRKNGVWR